MELNFTYKLLIFLKKNFRFKKVTAGLVARGHNVTVVTPQADISTHNVHYIYMEKVYETVYKSFVSDSKNVDPFDFSQTNPFAQLASYCGWMYNICSGFVESDGWETLKNYPNDFTVSWLSNNMLNRRRQRRNNFHLCSVRSSHTRFS